MATGGNGNGKTIGLALGLLGVASVLGATAGGIAGYEKAQDAQAVMASSIADQLDKLRVDAMAIRSQTAIDQQRRADEDAEARLHLEQQLQTQIDRRAAQNYEARIILVQRLDERIDALMNQLSDVDARLDRIEGRIYLGPSGERDER